MFYGQCWTCLERWELGTASTCKCPEETTIDWTEAKSPSPALTLSGIKPNYNMTFHRDGKQIGVLDFNGPEMTFTGDADESAKLFFDLIARSFKERLEQERADERNSWPAEMEAMERQVNILTDALNDRQRWFDAVTAQHKQAILAERETCAKVCDDASVPLTGELQSDAQWSALCLATAIRARSDT